MEDLLQRQIQDSCRLAMPEGLRDLMCDISREVLRAQPTDLYKFIVDYLSALLLTRETMSIACRVCRDVCECTCQPELEQELRNIGLEGGDLETAKNVVMAYFDKGEVKEGNLIMKLLSNTSLGENMLPAIQGAVRTAFLKHQLSNRNKDKEYIVTLDKANERGEKAAKHTLRFYEKFKNDSELRYHSATKIQAWYRGQIVRRCVETLLSKNKKDHKRHDEEMKKKHMQASTSKPRSILGRLSSTSLAGSLINLPKYVPYSTHAMTYEEFEECETERKNIDYTLETQKELKIDEGKKIVFHEHHILHEIKSFSIEEEEKEGDVEEEMVEQDVQSETTSVEENITEEKYFVKDIVNELVSSVNEEEEHQPDTAVEDIIEENFTEIAAVSDYEDVEDEDDSKYFDDNAEEEKNEKTEQQDLHEEVIITNSSKNEQCVVDKETKQSIPHKTMEQVDEEIIEPYTSKMAEQRDLKVDLNIKVSSTEIIAQELDGEDVIESSHHELIEEGNLNKESLKLSNETIKQTDLREILHKSFDEDGSNESRIDDIFLKTILNKAKGKTVEGIKK